MRDQLADAAGRMGVELRFAPREYCTDNAAMIAGVARFQDPLPYPDYLALDARATVPA